CFGCVWFFFSSRRRHTRSKRDWSSDVCSSDLATAYAEAGATIVFNDIKQELVDRGIASYKEKGIDAHGYVCDVTNEEAVQAMVRSEERRVGKECRDRWSRYQ